MQRAKCCGAVVKFGRNFHSFGTVWFHHFRPSQLLCSKRIFISVLHKRPAGFRLAYFSVLLLRNSVNKLKTKNCLWPNFPLNFCRPGTGVCVNPGFFLSAKIPHACMPYYVCWNISSTVLFLICFCMDRRTPVSPLTSQKRCNIMALPDTKLNQTWGQQPQTYIWLCVVVKAALFKVFFIFLNSKYKFLLKLLLHLIAHIFQSLISLILQNAHFLYSSCRWFYFPDFWEVAQSTVVVSES